jgi:hypothetical protein
MLCPYAIRRTIKQVCDDRLSDDRSSKFARTFVGARPCLALIAAKVRLGCCP